MNRLHKIVLIGLVLVCIAGAIGTLIWWQQKKTNGSSSTMPTRTLEEVRNDWQARVSAIIQVYDQEKNAAKARDALLKLTVPAEKRDIHLALVLALEGLSRQRAGAEADWQQAQTNYLAHP